MALALGDACTFVVNSDGALYSWGNNSYDQLGSFRNEQPIRPMAESTIPAQIREFGNHVKMVAAKRSHIACVMKDGTVFTWGETNFDEDSNPTFKAGPPLHLGRAEFQGEWATQVACSSCANWILTDKGSVFYSYTCTRRADVDPPPPGITRAALFAHEDDASQFYYCQLAPTSLCPRVHFSGMKISMIATGLAHVLAIGVVRGLWSWGHNGHGVLGRGSGDNFHTAVPTAVPVFNQHKLTYIATEGCHCMAVSAGTYDELGTVLDSGLWGWGYGLDGQLGTGDLKVQSLPTRNQDPCFQHENITMVACGAGSTAVLLETGALYMFGSTESMTWHAWTNHHHFHATGPAVIGMDLASSAKYYFESYRPQKVNPDHFYGARIVSIAIGYTHMAAITENGHLYMWYGRTIPRLFHPMDEYNAADPVHFMHQPYFGGTPETRQNQHRLDLSHIARYAAGQFRNVHEHRRRVRRMRE